MNIHNWIIELSDGIPGALEAIGQSILFLKQELPEHLHDDAICSLLESIEESSLKGETLWDRFKENNKDPVQFMESFQLTAA